MRVVFRYLSLALIAAIAYSCDLSIVEDGVTSPGVGETDPPYDRPTVPIKRRPIVPTTKLPRPRVIERMGYDGSTLSIRLAEEFNGFDFELVNLTTSERILLYALGSKIDINIGCGEYTLVLIDDTVSYTEHITLE